MDGFLGIKPYTNINYYLGNSAPYRLHGREDLLDSLDIYKYKSGTLFSYVYGALRCRNVVTNEPFTVKYIYKAKYDGTAEAIRSKEYLGWDN